jgi:hypothetical protein
MRAVKLFRGDTWQRTWLIRDAAEVPIDLTGAGARLHVRDADGALVAEASTLDGRLAITAVEGRIDLLMPYTATQLSPGSFLFDLEVTHASGLRRTYEQAVLVILEDMARD